jgi:hypothetical protein
MRKLVISHVRFSVKTASTTLDEMLHRRGIGVGVQLEP